MFNILVAEPDRAAAQHTLALLAGAGYRPMAAADGIQALEALTQSHIDLLVLGLALPQLDGFAVLHRLRRAGQTLPVLVLSARADHAAKCRALRLGADDYMVKPADEEELLLRIAALLRRAQRVSSRRLTVGGTTLYYDDLAVAWAGGRTVLPRKEFLLLYRLLSCPGKTFTRRQLLDEVWEMASDSGEHTVNVHIDRLRKKFRANADFAILTVRGLGYQAAVPPPPGARG